MTAVHAKSPEALLRGPIGLGAAVESQRDCTPKTDKTSKLALASASPVALPATDPDEQSIDNLLQGNRTELRLRRLSLSGQSNDSCETSSEPVAVWDKLISGVAPEPPVSKSVVLANRRTRDCDCRVYWPLIDEQNVSVLLGPNQRAPSPVKSGVDDDFLSQLVPMMPSLNAPKKIKAGNTLRSLPGGLVGVLGLENNPRPTPSKTRSSSSAASVPIPLATLGPLTLERLSPSKVSTNSYALTRSSASTAASGWSPASSTASSLDEPAENKNVAETLCELFHSMSSIIPDVLAACDNDGTAAFEKLHLQQDKENAAVEWSSPPPADAFRSLVDKVNILAEQYDNLPRGVIEEYLRRNNEDLDKASAQLLMAEDSREVQEKVKHDRVLALELSQSSPPPNQHRSQYKPNTDVAASASATPVKPQTGGSAAVRSLQACFPSAPQDLISTILHVSKDDLDLAKDILREQGHEEAPQKLDPSPFQGRQSPPQSPPRDQHIFGRNHQKIYEEHRAQGTAISRKIVQITQKGQELRQEARYHDACMVEAQIPELRRQARRADQVAKESIFNDMNKANCFTRECDLHGLHKREAVEKVHQLVEFSINDPVNDTYWRVITGRGKGSYDHVPKLRPAVEEYLDKRGIIHGLEEGNSGMVCFRIDRNQRLKPFDGQF